MGVTRKFNCTNTSYTAALRSHRSIARRKRDENATKTQNANLNTKKRLIKSSYCSNYSLKNLSVTILFTLTD